MSDFRIDLLRKQCIWQRTKGTKHDNGYPYHKHLPDCDICQGADEIERLQKRIRELENIIRIRAGLEPYKAMGEVDDLPL